MEIDDQGQRNQVLIPANVRGTFKVTIKGDDNIVRIGATSRFRGARIDVEGNHCEIVIGERCFLVGDYRCLNDRCVLHIGDDTTSLGSRVHLHEAGAVTIGRDCMFSGDTRIGNSDVHSVIDLATQKRINGARDVRIDDHVWLSFGVVVMKGVHIGAGSVVGACSVVTRKLPAHCAAGGSPAKVLRTNVTWNRKQLPEDELIPTAVRLAPEED